MSRSVLLLVPTLAEARALLGDGAPTGPTPRETSPRRLAALCGFGPAASGVLAGEAIDRARPYRVLLAGVAGAYRPDRLPVGTLLLATDVRAEVGRGRGEAFRSASALGFPQQPDSEEEVLPAHVFDAPGSRSPLVRGGLLTVACASATPEEARERADRDAEVLAEDMESFSVALACRRRGTPMAVLRGISNVAGDPDRGRWRMADALAAVRDALAPAMDALAR